MMHVVRLPLLSALALASLLLAGCASKPQTTTIAPPQWQAHKAQISAIERWQLRGRFGVISAEDSFSANLSWQQEPVTYRMVITSALGTTVAQLDGGPGQVKLSVPNQGDWYDSEPEGLLESMTGVQLPVSLLHSWVRGLPGSDQATEQTYTPEGYLASLSVPAKGAAPWKITMNRYREVNGVALPHNLVLQQADTRIKFAVNQWQLPDTDATPELAYAP